jgi:predicted ester cyclase
MATSETKEETKPKSKRKKSAKTLVREYFAGLAEQDLDRAVAVWKPGGIDTLHGMAELRAPEGIHQFFSDLFAAFPDWEFEIVELTGSGDTAAARWRVKATFSGPGYFQGVAPNGAKIELEGCDMFRAEDELIVANDAYMNGMHLAQQLGVLPPTGSVAERAMTGAFNAKTAATAAVRRMRSRG